MLIQLLMILVPLLWLTLTVLVLGACRAAARADAIARRREQSGELVREIEAISEASSRARGWETWRLAPRGHRP
jgi:hypothetical protein